MYCIKCGVELADSEKRCPLCSTLVLHPDFSAVDSDAPYPKRERVSRKPNVKGILFLITMAFVATIAELAIYELCFSNVRGWNGYAIGGIILLYVIAVLPTWFKRPNPVIFVPCDFAAILLYLLYINCFTGGKWFLSFAFPVTGSFALITTAVVTLVKYVRKGYYYIFGGALIAFGFVSVLIEFLLNITFGLGSGLHWSPFPFFGCLLLGLALIIIGICKPLKLSIEKKFFI